MKRHGTRFGFGAAALVVLCSADARVQAQTFPGNEPVLQQIWQQGMTQSSQAYKFAQALVDSVGPRLTGSPGHKAGNDWLVAVYRSLGIEARNEQYGTWKGWRRGITHIDLMTPRVRSLEGTMLAWSPGTNGQAVSAPVIIIPQVRDSAEFAAWLPQARGKFVLVSFPQPTCRHDQSWQQNADSLTFARMTAQRDSASEQWGRRLAALGLGNNPLGLGTGRLGRRLEEAGAAGVIASRWSNGWGVNKVFSSLNTRAPALDLSCEDYGLLFRLAENGDNPTVRVTADAEFLGEVPVFNTIGMIKGTQLPNEYVMLSAHFDSWDSSGGATDNATGTVTMLEAMRILKQVYPNPKRTILVGHWGGEEQGLNGSRAFAADNQPIVQGLQALFNQDNGTGRVRSIGVPGLPKGGEQMQRWVARLPSEMSRNLNVNTPGSPGGGGSDHASFVCHPYGAPAFSLSSIGFDYGTYTWHTNRDTFDKVSFDDLKFNATLTAMLAYMAADDPERVSRERRDLAAAAAANQGRGGGGGRGGRGAGRLHGQSARKHSATRRTTSVERGRRPAAAAVCPTDLRRLVGWHPGRGRARADPRAPRLRARPTPDAVVALVEHWLNPSTDRPPPASSTRWWSACARRRANARPASAAGFPSRSWAVSWPAPSPRGLGPGLSCRRWKPWKTRWASKVRMR